MTMRAVRPHETSVDELNRQSAGLIGRFPDMPTPGEGGGGGAQLGVMRAEAGQPSYSGQASDGSFNILANGLGKVVLLRPSDAAMSWEMDKPGDGEEWGDVEIDCMGGHRDVPVEVDSVVVIHWDEEVERGYSWLDGDKGPPLVRYANWHDYVRALVTYDKQKDQILWHPDGTALPVGTEPEIEWGGAECPTP